VHLLGGANPVHRVTWDALARRGRATAGELVEETGLAEEAIAATFTGFALQRVVVRHADGTVSPLSALLEEEVGGEGGERGTGNGKGTGNRGQGTASHGNPILSS
jgi:hypothetical protein